MPTNIRALTDAPARPSGLPIYFCVGDDPGMYQRAEECARRWAEDGVSESEIDQAIHDHFESGAAEMAGIAAGRGLIDPSFTRACWWMKDVYLDVRRRIADHIAAESGAEARDTLTMLASTLADGAVPEHAVAVAMMTVAGHLGISRAEAIRIANDALDHAGGAA